MSLSDPIKRQAQQQMGHNVNNNNSHSQITLNTSEVSSSDGIAKFRWVHLISSTRLIWSDLIGPTMRLIALGQVKRWQVQEKGLVGEMVGLLFRLSITTMRGAQVDANERKVKQDSFLAQTQFIWPTELSWIAASRIQLCSIGEPERLARIRPKSLSSFQWRPTFFGASEWACLRWRTDHLSAAFSLINNLSGWVKVWLESLGPSECANRERPVDIGCVDSIWRQCKWSENNAKFWLCNRTVRLLQTLSAIFFALFSLLCLFASSSVDFGLSWGEVERAAG